MFALRETPLFGLVLAICLAGFFHASLFGGKVLSPADVLRVEASFRVEDGVDYEPRNRLLMDPVLQFQPWLEFNRTMVRQGRLPLWNPYAGCGTPHLANGQSAVFDPFHLIAYLGSVPSALGWMAAGRLWAAGLGMFLLARAWGAGIWGRWFAGLVYPFCGFLVVWLLYPVTPVAIWLPWLLLATDRVMTRPTARSAGVLAVVVALVLFGGHIQTSAHVLLAAGLFALWRLAGRASARDHNRARSLCLWTAGIVLGLAVAAVQVVPLGSYLARSPVWGDRQRETGAWWTFAKPRPLDAVCTALPYAFGSQRGGHPNLAKALGVHNLNESAGGYAGLATLIWLAPLAIRSRSRQPVVGFLAGLTLFGFLAAFRFPPVDNLLRALPVLGVTDNRRLSLWVAFGLCALGGFGLDALSHGMRLPRWWSSIWVVCALVLVGVAASVSHLEPMIRERAGRHYRASAEAGREADPAVLQARTDRQVAAALGFIPRYYGLVAVELFFLAGLAWSLRRGTLPPRQLAAAVLGLTLTELGCFGFDLNPAIDLETHRFEPPVIARLRAGLGPGQRALGIGQELPPNVLMRFGLSDPRNYDSVELATSLNWLEHLYEPGTEAQTSRREITWDGVKRARERLEASCVGAVVGASPPPAGDFPRIERVSGVWIAWLAPEPWASAGPAAVATVRDRQPGRARIEFESAAPARLVVRESWVPGWTATIDGAPAAVQSHDGTFLALDVPSGKHIIEIAYLPPEWISSLFISIAGLAGVILALTAAARF